MSYTLKLVEKDNLNKNNADLTYVPFDDLESIEMQKIENHLIAAFKENTNRGKRRLKIKGNIEDQFIKLLDSEDLRIVFEQRIKDLKDASDVTSNGGVLISNDKVIHAIRINDQWYEYRQDISLDGIICSFIEPELARHILLYIKKSIIRIKNAQNDQDVLPYIDSIRLIKNVKPASHKPNQNAN